MTAMIEGERLQSKLHVLVLLIRSKSQLREPWTTAATTTSKYILLALFKPGTLLRVRLLTTCQCTEVE
jgi:hypothetical protein